jgi:ribosome-binding factor A
VRAAPWEIFVSRRHFSRDDFSSSLDKEFSAALEEEGAGRRRSRGRHQEHKTRQLCSQVQRALNLALTDLPGADLGAVFVSDVLPAPGSGDLLVYVAVPEDRAVADVLAELRALAPRLRAEVARSITRKRVPELSFIPGSLGGDPHD